MALTSWQCSCLSLSSATITSMYHNDGQFLDLVRMPQNLKRLGTQLSVKGLIPSTSTKKHQSKQIQTSEIITGPNPRPFVQALPASTQEHMEDGQHLYQAEQILEASMSQSCPSCRTGRRESRDSALEAGVWQVGSTNPGHSMHKGPGVREGNGRLMQTGCEGRGKEGR